MEELRKLDVFDVLKVLREEGIVCGRVVIDSQRFIKRCHVLGFDIREFKFLYF